MLSRKILLVILIFANFNIFSQKKSPEKPRLIVTVFIEGMRSDYLYKYWNMFSDDGFKKLVRKGKYYENAGYDYLYTKSSSGYATTVTGANPSQHGIVGDYWYKRLTNTKEYCVKDKNVSIVGTDNFNEGCSPASLLCSTFSDELRLSNFKQSKVISISMKDYAAVLPGGHLASACYWADKENAKWISSNYYFKDIPKWVKRFNEKKFPDIYLAKTWNTYYPSEKYKNSIGDDNSFEIGFIGGQHTFPYELRNLKGTAYDILSSVPFGNTYTKDFAVSAIVNEDLGKDEYCDYLNISFSATENITDKFGIRSTELEDAYVRLDRDLAHLISFIDDFVGLENTVIILTSDRGASDSPRFLREINMPGEFFKDKNAETLLNSFLRAVYNETKLVEYFDGSYLYLNRNKIEDLKLNLTEIQNKTADFIINFKGVANALSAFNLESRNYTSGMQMRAQNSYHKKRSGDISVILEPGYVPGSDRFYGSGYKHFTQVPLIFYGWKIKAGKVETEVSMTDIAPTLARFLKIECPNASTGKILPGISD